MSLFDLSGAVASMSANTATVTRLAADSFDSDGVAVAHSTASTFSIDCSFQPISGKEKILVPEGSRSSETVSIWTTSELRINDRVSVSGRGVFEVYDVSLWPDYGNYYKALARKFDASEPYP